MTAGLFEHDGPRWFSIPAHRPFLIDLAAGLIAGLDAESLSQAVVLTPTRRKPTREEVAAINAALDDLAAEFDLLALFARHPNRPLNRDQIMEQAHNRGWDVFDRSIDLRVMRLRRKIERNPDKPEILKTVRNVGYVFVPRP